MRESDRTAFLDCADEMRRAQRAYFAARQHPDASYRLMLLTKAKETERRFDDLLHKLKAGKKQASLFDSDDMP